MSFYDNIPTVISYNVHMREAKRKHFISLESKEEVLRFPILNSSNFTMDGSLSIERAGYMSLMFSFDDRDRVGNGIEKL